MTRYYQYFHITQYYNQIFTNIHQYYIFNIAQYSIGGIQYQYYSILPILLNITYSILGTAKIVLLCKCCNFVRLSGIQFQILSRIPPLSHLQTLGTFLRTFCLNCRTRLHLQAIVLGQIQHAPE